MARASFATVFAQTHLAAIVLAAGLGSTGAASGAGITTGSCRKRCSPLHRGATPIISNVTVVFGCPVARTGIFEEVGASKAG